MVKRANGLTKRTNLHTYIKRAVGETATEYSKILTNQIKIISHNTYIRAKNGFSF